MVDVLFVDFADFFKDFPLGSGLHFFADNITENLGIALRLHGLRAISYFIWKNLAIITSPPPATVRLFPARA